MVNQSPFGVLKPVHDNFGLGGKIVEIALLSPLRKEFV